jgi:hypothetical protein
VPLLPAEEALVHLGQPWRENDLAGGTDAEGAGLSQFTAPTVALQAASDSSEASDSHTFCGGAANVFE